MANQQIAKLLRAARASTKYARGHEWEAGIMLAPGYGAINHGFKPGYVTGHQIPGHDEVADNWEGEYCSWNEALRDAHVGDVLDFYVSSTGPSGELVTNVGIKILDEHTAVVQDCGENPYPICMHQ